MLLQNTRIPEVLWVDVTFFDWRKLENSNIGLLEMKQQLRELMQNAADHGDPPWDWEPETVAWEIQAYVDEFAQVDTEQMIEVIKEIQEEMNK
jgi:hypothetical protein